MARESHRPSPRGAAEWGRVVRFLGNTVLGWFLLIWSTVFRHPADPTIVGAALAVLLGYPALEMLRSVSRDNNGNGDPVEEEKP